MYTHFFFMWDFVLCFKCVGDMAAQGASDARIEDKSSIFPYGGGYVVESYSSANHF